MLSNLSALGAAVSMMSGFVTLIAGIVAVIFKRKLQRDSRDAELKEKLIAATEWIFDVRLDAAQQGVDLRPLPDILQLSYVKQKAAEQTQKDDPWKKFKKDLEEILDKKMEMDGEGDER